MVSNSNFTGYSDVLGAGSPLAKLRVSLSNSAVEFPKQVKCPILRPILASLFPYRWLSALSKYGTRRERA